MICQLSGRLETLEADTAVVIVQGVGYEVLIPALAAGELQSRVGHELTLHTVQYFEGNPAGANLVPRLVGFVRPTDREFFDLFTKVRGVSIRRALRAMCVPVAQLAGAIEQGDVRALTGLPEIGRKTATEIINALRGKLQAFGGAEGGAVPSAVGAELSDAQQVAVDILVQWGDRRADAQRWVVAAAEQDPELVAPEALVRGAYRVKESGRVAM